MIYYYIIYGDDVVFIFSNFKYSKGNPLEKCGLFKSKLNSGDWAYLNLKDFIKDYI